MALTKYDVKIFPRSKFGLRNKKDSEFSGSVFLLGENNREIYDVIISIKANLFTSGEFDSYYDDLSYSMALTGRSNV